MASDVHSQATKTALKHFVSHLAFDAVHHLEDQSVAPIFHTRFAVLHYLTDSDNVTRTYVLQPFASHADYTLHVLENDLFSVAALKKVGADVSDAFDFRSLSSPRGPKPLMSSPLLSLSALQQSASLPGLDWRPAAMHHFVLVSGRAFF